MFSLFSLFSLIGLIVSGLLTGVVARSLVSGRDPGTFMTVSAGVAGSVVGPLAARLLGWPSFGFSIGLVLSVAIAAVLLTMYEQFGPTDPTTSRTAEHVSHVSPSIERTPPSTPRQSMGVIIGISLLWASAGALMMGIAGFTIGFVGPIKFQPWSNQGPMLGIFVTGPLGIILGGVIGGALKLFWPDWTVRRMLWTLNAAALTYSLFVLHIVTDRSWWP